MSDLVTLARAQQSPILAGLDTTWLATLISAASAAIERKTHRSFVSTAATEKYDGDGTRQIMLKRFPLTVLTEIVVTDQSDDSTETFAGSVFNLNLDTAEVRFKPAATGLFLRGFQNIAATYTAGFATVPENLQEGTVQLIAMLVSAGENDPALVAEKLGDYSYRARVENGVNDAGLWPVEIRRLIGTYKDWLV